jgi:hypothetical protein
MYIDAIVVSLIKSSILTVHLQRRAGLASEDKIEEDHLVIFDKHSYQSLKLFFENREFAVWKCSALIMII